MNKAPVYAVLSSPGEQARAEFLPLEACNLTREADINVYTGRIFMHTNCEKYAGQIVYIETVTVGGCSSIEIQD